MTKEAITLALVGIYFFFSAGEFPYEGLIIGATVLFRVFDTWMLNTLETWNCEFNADGGKYLDPASSPWCFPSAN